MTENQRKFIEMAREIHARDLAVAATMRDDRKPLPALPTPVRGRPDATPPLPTVAEFDHVQEMIDAGYSLSDGDTCTGCGEEIVEWDEGHRFWTHVRTGFTQCSKN